MLERVTNLWTPPFPEPPDEVYHGWRFFYNFVQDPLTIVPRAAFTEPYLRLQRQSGREVLAVTDPAMLDEVLVRQADKFPKSPLVRRTLSPAVGEDSIFTAEGADWRWQRRASSPPFRHDNIISYIPAMRTAAEDTPTRLLKAGADGPIDVAEEMMTTTFDIIVETMLSGRNGLDLPRFSREITHYFDTTTWNAALFMLGLPSWFPHPGRSRGLKAIAWMNDAMLTTIARRRAAPLPEPDLLDMLIAARDPETGRGMTDSELARNLLTFVVAGHETTAVALAWTLWLVAQTPAVEQRLVDEIDAVCGDAPVTAAHVEALTYCRQVVQEAMRLYPPAPIILRIANQDTEVCGLKIKERTPVTIPIFAVHRHEKLWDNPRAFDPDRFSEEASRGRPRSAYLPFGGGPRICIGASFALVEASVILATVLRDVSFRLPPNPEAVEPRLRLTLRPKGGMPLMVARRQR